MQESILTLYHVGSRDCTQVGRLSSKHLYQLSHLTDLQIFKLEEDFFLIKHIPKRNSIVISSHLNAANYCCGESRIILSAQYCSIHQDKPRAEKERVCYRLEIAFPQSFTKKNNQCQSCRLRATESSPQLQILETALKRHTCLFSVQVFFLLPNHEHLIHNDKDSLENILPANSRKPNRMLRLTGLCHLGTCH